MPRIGKHSRLAGRAIGQLDSFGIGSNLPDEEEFNVEVMNPAGMNTTIDSSLIQNNEFIDVKDFYIRDARFITRKGLDLEAPVKPNSNKILGLYNFIRYSGALDSLRFTRNSVHKLSGGVWTAIAGGGLTGGDFDRFDIVFVEDDIYFSNSGIEVLQKINLAANTYAAAGTARKYKYYTVANNRIIGANLLGASPSPIEIAGSGDRNYSEWDPTVDISAFRNFLVDGEEESIDEITGVESQDNIVCVLRSKSIWLGIPQPSGTTPFSWKKAIPKVGCNAPYTVRKVAGGIAWWDPIVANILFFDMNERKVIPIGDKIRRTFASNAGDPTYLFSSFDDTNREYEIGIEIPASGIAKVWRFHQDNGNWSYDEIPAGSCISNSVALTPSVSIDALGSTPIDSLSGTIDSLSTSSFVPKKVYGRIDGERQVLSLSSGGQDLAVSVRNINHSVTSKLYRNGDRKSNVLVNRLLIVPNSQVNVKIYVSINGRAFTLVKTIPIDASLAGKNVLVKHKKNYHCDTYQFKYEFTGGTCDFLGYWLKIVDGGPIL
jgi:hypothetical protein